MNTTQKVLELIEGDARLLSWLRDVANGDRYEYGDVDLGCCVSDLIDASEDTLSQHFVGFDVERIIERRLDLPDNWLDEIDWEELRKGLLA